MSFYSRGLSIIAILALSTQGVVAEEPTVPTDRDSSYTIDFNGVLGGDLVSVDDHPCNVNTGADFRISEELLLTEPFDRNMSTGIFTLGVQDPTAISDPTVEITFPGNIMDIDQIEALAYSIIDINATTPGYALTYSHRDGTSSKLVYNAAASTDLYNGHNYCIATGEAVENSPATNLELCAGLPYHLDQNTSADTYKGNIEWSVFSNSGTSERRDYGKLPVELIVEPQFSIKCVSDLDGLINWENGRKSFVANKHDLDAGDISSTANDKQNTVVDTLIFDVVNAAGTRVDGSCDNGLHNFDAWLDGNLTEFNITATNDINLTTDDWSLTLTSTRTDVEDGTGNFIVGDTATFLTANQEIFNGITQYHASYDYSTGYTNGNPIEETTFSGDVALEGFSGVRPLVSMSDKNNLGEWQNHAYIAQIPGATQDAATQTKLFIVNRGCAPVTPTFILIKDGLPTEVTGTEIPVNTQQKITLDSLLTTAGLPEGRYAVEIIIGGEAEDFYVYAQAQGKTDKSITKDLPVYTTSNRN